MYNQIVFIPFPIDSAEQFLFIHLCAWSKRNHIDIEKPVDNTDHPRSVFIGKLKANTDHGVSSPKSLIKNYYLLFNKTVIIHILISLWFSRVEIASASAGLSLIGKSAIILAGN